VIKRIVLALDGSPESQHALPVAEELARATGAAVTVVHVREMMLAPVVGGVPRRMDEGQAEATVRAGAESLLAAGIDTDLQIVAGTRGIGVIKGLLVGSVAHRLLYIATCPVLTVPLPPDSESG
jgi:nucleotide-binding universal stress UspA family protein